MASAAELGAREPLAVRRAYYACDCNQGGRGEACQARHALDGVFQKVCPECGDQAETHYLMVPVVSNAWTGFYAARRGHDDDDPKARKAGLACEGAPKEGEA